MSARLASASSACYLQTMITYPLERHHSQKRILTSLLLSGAAVILNGLLLALLIASQMLVAHRAVAAEAAAAAMMPKHKGQQLLCLQLYRQSKNARSRLSRCTSGSSQKA